MIPGMPRASYNSDVIRITKLDADGVPTGESMSTTGRITKINTGDPVRLTPEQQREEAHAWEVRADKERREFEEKVNRVAPRIAPFLPQPVHDPRLADLVAGNSWIAPSGTDYGQQDVPGLRSVNHPCKLIPDAQFPDWIHDIKCLGKTPPPPRQEERPHSMYSDEAIRQAAYTLQQEREAREAQEIIDRIKAFGDDVYADDTVLRVSRQFYKNAAKTQLHDPAVFAILRYTDDCGNTHWTNNTGTGRTWDALVAWFVTHGKPITLADVEVIPPAVFPATSGTSVETTITGTVQ